MDLDETQTSWKGLSGTACQPVWTNKLGSDELAMMVLGLPRLMDKEAGSVCVGVRTGRPHVFEEVES